MPRWAMGWAAEMTDRRRDGLGMRKCRKVNAAEQMSWKCRRVGKRGSMRKTQTVGSRSRKSLVKIIGRIIVKSWIFSTRIKPDDHVLSCYLRTIQRASWSSVEGKTSDCLCKGVEHGQCHILFSNLSVVQNLHDLLLILHHCMLFKILKCSSLMW